MPNSSISFGIISLCFTILLVVSNANALQVVLDTQSQLDLIGSSTNCIYAENYEELCKNSPAHPGSKGYWSSCDTFACEIVIPVGSLLPSGDLPTQIQVFSFLEETRAEIRLRYRLMPDSQVVNINPSISGSTDWSTSIRYDIDGINGFNSESEILVRLSSNPFPTDSDILDKIIFHFEKEGVETTTTNNEGTTTTNSAGTTTNSEGSTTTSEPSTTPGPICLEDD